MRDTVPSTLTTRGPRWSSLTVVPSPETSRVVAGSPGAGSPRPLGFGDGVDGVSGDEDEE